MAEGTLYIGNRRYSSWSMRGWLAVRVAGLDVGETLIPFVRPGPTPALRDVSPSGLVPCLAHRGALIWDSLAICEYSAEQAPALWPGDRAARAHARSIAAEMHAGFGALRSAMWMNLGADFVAKARGHGRTPEALADIARIEAIWADTRERFGGSGPFLFGPVLTAADVMFAPVVTRFLTWQPALGPVSREYCAAVRGHPLVAAWYDAAAREPDTWRLAECETLPTSGPAAEPPPLPPEIGGPQGPEPTRYGDWERKGRCIDF